MKRWNGWGDETVQREVPEDGVELLAKLTGKATPRRDQTQEEMLQKAAGSSFRGWEGVDTTPQERLLHARGQSFPDWLALRLGYKVAFPEGVIYPRTEDEIRSHLTKARHEGARIVIYGGGTSVVGHINRPSCEAPILVMDMSRMSKLRHVDTISRLGTFEAGVQGPDIERQLRPYGLLLGHFPQSYEYSTLGGWIATRSSGQQSLYYGRIEDLFAGGRLITAEGVIEIPPLPASSAGPDLKHLLLGSEGRLGVISEATMRLRSLPEKEEFHGVFFPSWNEAEIFARQAVQEKLPLSMIRLSSARETWVTLALAGHPQQIRWLERYLSFRGLGDEKCLLILGLTGTSSQVKATKAETFRLSSQHRGIRVGQILGKSWQKHRFQGPYLRNALWEKGWGVDTLETALPYERIRQGVTAIEGALQDAAKGRGESILVYTHLSHFYTTGCAIYVTYIFRLQNEAAETYDLWLSMKEAANQAILRMQGTISHQHGVGKDHKAALLPEKSEIGIQWLSSLFQEADPSGLFANGNLIDRKEA